MHCVRIPNDGLVYVCDRANDRIQVFRKDGSFVKEFRVEPKTLQNGSVWDLVLSTDPQQRFIFMADGANNQIVTLLRDTGEVVTSWGRGGRTAAQFKWVHGIAVDSKGKLYTAEVGYGRRAQKFSRAIDAAGLPAGSCAASCRPSTSSCFETKTWMAGPPPGRSARGRPWRLNDMHKKDPGSWGGRGFFRTVGRGDRDRSSIALLRE